jgi:hypothetical protein
MHKKITTMTLNEWRKVYKVPVFVSAPCSYHKRIEADEPLPAGAFLTVFESDCPDSGPLWDMYHLVDYIVTAAVSGPARTLTPRRKYNYE